MKKYPKFRVWCETIKMFTDGGFYVCSGGQLLWLHTGNQISISNLDDGEYCIQQFTGWLDKNNKEIYEGDIVKIRYKMDEHGEFEEEISEVTFEDGAFGIKSDCFFNWSFASNFSIEVIGNIFENKELLK